MNLPRSSLLGRLEAFLPEIEKANQTTEKLAQEGTLEVLDKNLEVAGTDQQREEAGTDEEEGEEEEQEQAPEGEALGIGAAPRRTVQLDFALGDFDDTPIAKMERDKEEANQAEGAESGATGGMAEEEGGVEGESGVAGLVRVVPQTEVDAVAPREKSRKPLIEEL